VLIDGAWGQGKLVRVLQEERGPAEASNQYGRRPSSDDHEGGKKGPGWERVFPWAGALASSDTTAGSGSGTEGHRGVRKRGTSPVGGCVGAEDRSKDQKRGRGERTLLTKGKGGRSSEAGDRGRGSWVNEERGGRTRDADPHLLERGDARVACTLQNLNRNPGELPSDGGRVTEKTPARDHQQRIQKPGGNKVKKDETSTLARPPNPRGPPQKAGDLGHCQKKNQDRSRVCTSKRGVREGENQGEEV